MEGDFSASAASSVGLSMALTKTLGTFGLQRNEKRISLTPFNQFSREKHTVKSRDIDQSMILMENQQ
jgi:hypothetical protein